jgi:hypothetical protein
MPYLRIFEARIVGQTTRSFLSKSASQILAEDSRRFSPSDRYDVFLSHVYKDGELILGVKSLIEAQGLSVYVDWIDDAGLDRETVTRSTAKVLRERMRASSCLIYAHSVNAGESLWMPWELGYFRRISFDVWEFIPIGHYELQEFSLVINQVGQSR